MSTTAPATLAGEQFLGHPKGLFVCFMTEMWERFAFYGMKALLLLYLTKHHLFDDTDGYLLLGSYAGLAYALPLLGGIVADRWIGMRKAVVFGGLLLIVGQLGMAYTGSAASLVEGQTLRDTTAIQVMYFSLALIGVGVGFLKPNISTIVGRLYPENDPRRDSGFTLFYMGINVGALLSSFIIGYVGIAYGWGWGFGLSGVMMALGLVQFLMGRRHLMGQAEPPASLSTTVEARIYAGGLVLVAVVWQVLQTKINFGPLSALVGGHEVTLTELVAVVLGAALYLWFIRLLFSGISAAEKGRMITLMVLITVSALFWGLYEQTYGPWIALADRGMDLQLGLGISMNAAQTTGIGAFWVIALAPVFVWLWPKLDKRGWNPSYPAKFAWALVFCGLAFGVLAFATATPNSDTGLVSLWWMILAYLILVMGEMALSPIGLSAVTTLSIPRVVGLMMGAWFLFSAFGEIIAGRLATWSALPQDASRELALATYTHVFTSLMWVGLAAGAAMFVATPLLNRLSRA